MIDERGLIATLISVLKDGRTAEERSGAARGLGYATGAEAIVALREALIEGRTAEERTAAAEALGRALANSRS
ncbi:hypothetical protein [Pseudomonas sp. NFIX28]|uniref:hypothetical protein n=1 Tax=Pseudomonas sp. NFIX28 TaxID=1566235 RepID=UPI001113D18F|nr:hypothetical protein [Pseudomonas sp. NFIX28]